MIEITLGETIRFLLVSTVYCVLPGFIVIYYMYGVNRLCTARLLSLSIGWSVALNILIAYLVHFCGGTLGHYGVGMMIFIVICAAFALAKFRRLGSFALSWKPKAILPAVLVLVLSLLWFGVILQNGPRIDYLWDQWFHMAHVREAIESNQIIPGNPFWADVPLSDVYGLWHPILAIIARAVRLDVIVLWRLGNALMAGFSVTVMYSVAMMIANDHLASFVAAVVFLGSGVGAQQITRTFIYPWGISYLCMWLGLGLFFIYLKERDRRSLVSATVIGFAPIFIHPQEFIFFCFGLFVLGFSASLMRIPSNRLHIDPKTIWLFLLVLVILGGGILIAKYPNRVSLSFVLDSDKVDSGLSLYPHPLASWLAAAFPYYWKLGMLFYNLMAFGLASLLFVFFLPKDSDPEVLWFLRTLTVAPFLFAILPGLSWITHLVIRETYSWRLLNLIPTPIIWALVIVRLIPSKKPSSNSVTTDRSRLFGGWNIGRLVCFIMLMVVVGFAIGMVVIRDELNLVEEGVTPLQSPSLFEELDAFSPEPVVVLSDPRTSYAVPGLTKHHVVLNEPSHGSRDDIVTWFVDTRELLSSPYQLEAEALATLKRYNVDLILVNKTLLNEPFFLEVPLYSDFTLEFLRDNTACFPRLYSDVVFELFEVVGCAPRDIQGKGHPHENLASSENIEYFVQRRLSHNLSFLGFSLRGDDRVYPGHSKTVDLYWRAEKDLEEPYAIWLELLCKYPGDHLPYGRLLRVTNEYITDTTFETVVFTWLPIPASGVNSDEIWMHSLDVSVSENISEGPCSLSLYILDREQALYGRDVLPFLFMEREYTLPGISLMQMSVNN